jgi:hypothetical protein
MEVLAENHIEMELIDGETLDTLYKRFLLVSNYIYPNADHLRGTELDIELRKAGLTIADFSIVEMLKNLYGQTESDSFSYFLLELENR